MMQSEQDQEHAETLGAMIDNAIGDQIGRAVRIDQRTGEPIERWWMEMQYLIERRTGLRTELQGQELMIDDRTFDARLVWGAGVIRLELRHDPIHVPPYGPSALEVRLKREQQSSDEQRAHELEAELAAVRARLGVTK